MAVFEIVPVAVEATVAVTLNVAEPPLASVTGAVMLPVPPAGHDDPPGGTGPVAPVSEAGSVSVTVAPVTVDGPVFEATIV